MMNYYEEMESWYKIRQICGREPLQWFLVNHIRPGLTKGELSAFEALRGHYDKSSIEIMFRLLEERATWIWLQHFLRALSVSGSELDERQHRIGLFYYEWDVEELPFGWLL